MPPDSLWDKNVASKAMVKWHNPTKVIGVLKEQRGLRQFRRRGLAKVAVELALAATAFNLTRLWRTKPTLDRAG